MQQAHLIADQLKNATALSRRRTGLPIALGARHHHLAAAEEHHRRPRLVDAHDDGAEALRIVLRVANLHHQLVEVQLDAVVGRRDDVVNHRFVVGKGL